MTNYFNSFKSNALALMLISLVAFTFMDCKSEVSMEKQQKAFHVDANGNLLNKKGNVVKKAGEYKMEGGYYVDSNGERIKRDIDKAKEKLNATVDKTKAKLSKTASEAKGKLGTAVGDSKEKLSDALGSTKETVSNVASNTKESVKANFNRLFNTKAVGTVYTVPGIEFDKESHRLTKMSKEEMEGLAAALKEHPESRIQVQVHTADGENKKACKEMSTLRAKVVKDMMVTLGVNADQISAKGLGLTVEDAAKAVANTVEVVVEK